MEKNIKKIAAKRLEIALDNNILGIQIQDVANAYKDIKYGGVQQWMQRGVVPRPRIKILPRLFKVSPKIFIDPDLPDELIIKIFKDPDQEEKLINEFNLPKSLIIRMES